MLPWIGSVRKLVGKMPINTLAEESSERVTIFYKGSKVGSCTLCAHLTRHLGCSPRRRDCSGTAQAVATHWLFSRFPSLLTGYAIFIAGKPNFCLVFEGLQQSIDRWPTFRWLSTSRRGRVCPVDCGRGTVAYRELANVQIVDQ